MFTLWLSPVHLLCSCWCIGCHCKMWCIVLWPLDKIKSSDEDPLVQILSWRSFDAGPLMKILWCRSSHADPLMQDSLMKILWCEAYPWEHMGAHASAAAQWVPITNHRTSPSQQSMRTTIEHSSSNQRQPSSQMVFCFCCTCWWIAILAGFPAGSHFPQAVASTHLCTKKKMDEVCVNRAVFGNLNHIFVTNGIWCKC